ncbi:glycosyltransferase family 4 protein [Larsenimonas rhizosphaerae]|uniref:glycosyltransferase family 4 protein n=1 Tax=Larsenimonas rhizosphaerae TaxID=2944682 RepID=UPI00203358CC|nr:glycosyltransferase family 4 protein [Larsenimonas rhizosphaerae]MCM2130747.1 glycosyltransferase family 4 protein [Larsenimonas rhizosphaerae]
MNISHFASFNVAGGIGLLSASLVHALEARGHHNLLVNKGTHIAPAIQQKMQKSVPVMSYKKPGRVRIPGALTHVRTHSLTRALKQHDRPDVLLSWSQLNAVPLIKAHRKLGATTIHYDHGSAWRSNPSAARLDHLKACEAVICVSNATRRMLELRWGVDHVPLIVQHNPLMPGQEVTCEATTDRPARQKHRYRLGMVGRLVPVKGFPIALKALKIIRDRGLDVELHIIGTGMMEAALRQECASLGLEGAVQFHGYCSDINARMAEFDILLCPSFRETFGLVSVEAAAAGCPVIGSRVDGLPETLSEGITGMTLPCTEAPASVTLHANHESIPEQVYDPDTDTLRAPLGVSPKQLADATAELLLDETRRKNMGIAGQALVRERFGFDRYVDNMVSHLHHYGTTR